MNNIGYIDEEGQKLKVEFALDKNNCITPKSKQDREILISAWDINEEILQPFIDFVNSAIKTNEEKIALLTNTKKYQFLDNEEIYNKAVFKVGEEAKREEIEALIDKIYESTIFSYEDLALCPKSKADK